MLLDELVPSSSGPCESCGPNGCQANTCCPTLNPAWNAEIYEHLLFIGLKEAGKAALKFTFILCKTGKVYVIYLKGPLSFRVFNFVLPVKLRNYLPNLKHKNTKKKSQNLTQVCKIFLTAQACFFNI